MKISTAFAAAGLLALSACGGAAETNTASNNVEEVNLSADGLTATDNLDANTLGNEANALANETGNLAGAADANSTDTGADNATANSTGNSH